MWVRRAILQMTIGTAWRTVRQRHLNATVRTNICMSVTTTHELSAAIRAHHRALAETLDNYTAEVEAGITEHDTARLAELLDGLTAFLSGDLLPHAAGEEKTLYPALDPIIRDHGSPTATMRVDHEYIGDYARQIAE